VLIDAHIHYGTCRVFDRDLSEETLSRTMDEFEFALSIAQPYPGTPDPVGTHDAIASFGRESGGRVVGLASYNPHRDPAEYFAEIQRCVRDLAFVGVKLHTLGHAVNPGSRDGETVFATAKELGIPVMIHTGPGIPFSDPAAVLPRARQFPDVTIVLAHAGSGVLAMSAIAVAEVCDNIFLEPSWCRTSEVAPMIRRLGADRVMLGTDAPANAGVELAKYRALDLNEQDYKAVTGGTAMRVFKLSIP
jgi:predicted TIM-barrel fold metal-dependent hydrolase